MKKVGDGIYPPEKQLWLGLDSETVSITPSVREAGGSFSSLRSEAAKCRLLVLFKPLGN